MLLPTAVLRQRGGDGLPRPGCRADVPRLSPQRIIAEISRLSVCAVGFLLVAIWALAGPSRRGW